VPAVNPEIDADGEDDPLVAAPPETDVVAPDSVALVLYSNVGVELVPFPFKEPLSVAEDEVIDEAADVVTDGTCPVVNDRIEPFVVPTLFVPITRK